MRWISWLGLWWCVLWCQAASASAVPTLLLEPTQLSYSTRGVLGQHIDSSGTLSLADVQNTPFVLAEKPRSGGFTNAAHWFHLRLQRQADAPSDWVLALGEPFLDHVHVWVVQSEGGTPRIESYRFGDHALYSQRPIISRNFALHVAVSDRNPTDVYIRVQSISSLNFKATIWQPDAFWSKENQSNLYQGLAFGAIAIFLLINLIFGLRLRDASILFFALYLASLLLLFIGLKGFVPMLVDNVPTWLNDAITGTGVLGGLAAVMLMLDRIFNLQSSHPYIHRSYWAMAVLCIALIPFSVTDYYRIIAPIIFQFSFLYMLSALVMVAILWFKNKALEFFLYLLAVLINVIGGFTQISMALGWINNNAHTENTHQWLSLAQAFIMSLGLLIRIGNIQSAQLNLIKEMEMAALRNAEQRRFAAILSHEFRTPLAAIDRAAEMISYSCSSLAEAASLRIKKIRAQVFTLSNLVDVFLSTESIQHGRLQVQPEPHNLSVFLMEEIQLLNETMLSRLHYDLDDSVQVWSFDKIFLGMALRNLVINALRYSPEDHPVTLQTRLVNDSLHICVIDGGNGLRSEELAQLGQPYYRATSSSGQHGTGLGYFFTRQIVVAHGGTLSARNLEGGGFEVCMSLPRNPLPQIPIQPKSGSCPPLTGR